MNTIATDQRKFFTKEDVTNLESFLSKHREKILDLFDKNSPNYIKRKSFVSERMKIKDTFEEYLNGGIVSEKTPSKSIFHIFQQSKRDIANSTEFLRLSREEQIKLYEFVQSLISKYMVSNKTHNSESYEENIIEINSDMSSWNSDNLALLKLSI